MNNYLEHLPLTEEEKSKLQGFGAESPVALLSIIQANHDAFEVFFGKKRTNELEHALRKLVKKHNFQTFSKLPNENFELGAIVGKKIPELKPPDYDLEERDRLFDELQFLQSQDSSSDEVKKRISEISNELNQMLQDS